jgi:hypothetical protein
MTRAGAAPPQVQHEYRSLSLTNTEKRSHMWKDLAISRAALLVERCQPYEASLKRYLTASPLTKKNSRVSSRRRCPASLLSPV